MSGIPDARGGFEMCHEQWWAERRNRHARESREVWLDFEQTRPVDDPGAPEEEPDTIRLETEDEPVTAER